MNQLLKEAREGIQAVIDNNKSKLTLKRYQKINNGFGKMIIDTNSVPTEIEIQCRISNKDRGPFDLNSTQAGQESDMTQIILTNYKTQIQEYDFFDSNRLRIGKVDELKYLNNIIGYQANLYNNQ